MTGAEAAIIAAVGKLVATVLPKVLSKMEEVVKKRKGLEGLVESLRGLLSTIQANILDSRKATRSHNGTSQAIATFIANLRCCAYDMEDYIEGYEAKTIQGVKLYNKITELKTALWELIRLHNQLIPASGEGGASSSPTSTPTASHANTSYPLTDLFSVDVKPLHELLFHTKGSDEAKVIVISVVGFGSMGKTKLCEQVYSEVLRKNVFPRHAFVSAAGKDRNTILEEIILSLSQQGSQQGSDQNILQRTIAASTRTVMNILGREAQVGNGGNANASGQSVHPVNEYMAKLAECLLHGNASASGQSVHRDNRYLIAIDDVESEELGKFISYAFPQDIKGSRIIMAINVPCSTSQSRDDQYSESIMVVKPQRFQIVGSFPSTSLLMMQSDGVPHALVSISGVLRRQFSADDVDEAWRRFRIAEADCWRQTMPLVLPHGYDSLTAGDGSRSYVSLYIPDPQACLLYFAMFPRGNNVKRASLIRRWLAEGRQLGGTSINAAANNMNLIDRNFIRPLHVSLNQDQYVKTCQPPDEVIDYITKMSQEEDFIMQYHDEACSAALDCTRRLSLHPTGVLPNGCSSRRNPTEDDTNLPPRLRTLAVYRSTNANSIVKCKQLRVLDMEEYGGLEESQFDEICKKLILLRYLSLRADKITKVPSSISYLQHLGTLHFVKAEVVLLPIAVLKLPCLKNLLGRFKLIDSIIPNRSLGAAGAAGKVKTSKLERIEGFVTCKGQGIPPLMCHMKKLWKVKIWFSRDAVARSLASFLPEAIKNFLDKNDNVDRTLTLDFQEYDCPSPEELLKSLDKAKGRLYSLKLCAKNLSGIPQFVINLTGITKLCLSWGTITLDDTFLNELSKLNQLKYLKLVADEVKGVYDENPQGGNNNQPMVVVIKATHIKNVEQMWLVSKSRLPEILIEPGTLEKLVSIHLISEDLNCPSANMIRNTDRHRQANPPLKNLMEVTLNAAVSSHTKKDWHQAARDHHRCPRILFIRNPRHAG